ncbi:MAG: hypothetical protein KHW67_06620 [Lachnospiraceae bacterium]|nr:hypothetical protein [Lachnospiraceae bacterium]
MKSRFKKLAASVLTAAMLLQQCGVTTLAEEAQTQAETQIQTQAETPAPETQAPQTETSAPETQAPQTETSAPETQAPQTETSAPETQAPQTETSAPETQAPQTETEKATEKETEKKKEKETEASDRVNDGKKIEESTVTSRLGSVRTKLFAADSVILPDTLKEQVGADWILDGTDGKAAVDGLSGLSKTLANGQSTSKVEVINLYADKDGKLDTKQLEKLFKDKVIDVTDQYFVVNIIAAKKDQTLSFSGYAMKNKGQNVSYTKATQAGDILYNFATLEKGKYQAFEGTVNLSSGSGLQGTFLAPKAAVTVGSDLSGAVYAKKVTVADGVQKLLRVAYIKGAKDEVETEAVTEAATETESDAEAQTEQVTEAQTTGETEAQTEQVTEAQTAGVTEAQTEQVTEAQTTGETEARTEQVTEAQTEGLTIETEVVTEVPEQSETAAEAGSEPAETSEEESPIDLDAGIALTSLGRELMWYSQTGVELSVKFADAEAAAAVLSGGEAELHAADTILKPDGSVAYAADEKVGDTLTNLGSEEKTLTLNYGGSYYLEIKKAPGADGSAETYLTPARIYFEVDKQGVVRMAVGQNLTDWSNGVLTVKAEKQTQAQVNIVLADADGNALVNAGTSIFVLKDEKGAVIYNSNTKASEENEPTEAKYPLYYISGLGSQLKLSGIPAGSYYLSEVKAPDGYELADDQKFILTDGGAEQTLTMKHKEKEGTAKVNVAVQATFTKTLLTAENDIVNYVALYSDSKLSQRVTEPKAVTFKAGDTTSSVAEFSALTDGTTYYIGLTDAFGEKAGTDYQLSDNAVAAKAAEDEQAVLDIDYTTYPDGDYSYQADISVTVQVKDVQGAAYAASDTFYAMLYQDADRTQKVLSTPLTFAMSGAAALTQSTQVKMTKASETFYLAQTDANGTEITNADPNFLYGITYPDLTNQALTVVCGQKAAATIQDQLGNSIVMLRLLDAASDKQLPGAKMVIKDAKTGKAVYSFTTGNEVETLTNKLAAGRYVLTELIAPGGYSNTPDVAFEVKDGQTTEVVMRNASYGKSAHKLTVSMQVYVRDAQVYAKDTTSGTFAKEKRYTYYAALFADKARTQKVSDVKEITVSGLSGSASFSNLEKGTYYLAETDEYGNVLSASDIHGTECKIEYSDGGKVSVSASSAQAVIKNVYSSLPKGYRHTATLTITKKLQTASGEAQTATKTFYAGIYRKKDFSDTPTVVALDLKNASEASAKRRILLSSSNEVNYYIAEVDKSGKRITDEASFGYTIQVDQPEVTLKGGEEKHVTITNKTRVSKVTLYLTKKVYEGTSKKAVNETFYAGLFKDPEFTQLYAKPIALQLKNKSEITLKLSLNLGAAAGAKIYVAEVDENGKVVQAGAKFGYDIRVINATAEFTQEQTEVQSILLNSVYSSSSEDNWNKIISRDGNNIGGGGIGSGSNGGGGASANGSVQTGDETPILPYVGGLAAAALVIAVLLVAGRRKRQK